MISATFRLAGRVSKQCFTSPPTQYRLYGRRGKRGDENRGTLVFSRFLTRKRDTLAPYPQSCSFSAVCGWGLMKRRSAPTKGPWTWGSGKNFTFHHWHHDWGGYQGLVGLSTLRQYKQIKTADEEWIQCNRKGSEHSQIMLEEFPGQGASSKPSKNRPYPAIVNTETCWLNKRTISDLEWKWKRTKMEDKIGKQQNIKWYTWEQTKTWRGDTYSLVSCDVRRTRLRLNDVSWFSFKLLTQQQHHAKQTILCSEKTPTHIFFHISMYHV